MNIRMLSLLYFLTILPGVVAQERTHLIIPEDYASMATATQCALSPDGQFLAYVEARWQISSDDRKSDLWVVGTSPGSKPIRLTSDRANDRDVKWSADGQNLYFLGNRKREGEKKAPYDGTTQVWCLPRVGGELFAVTRVEGGVTGYDLARTVGQLFYSVDSSDTEQDDFSKMRSSHSKLNYGHGKRTISELWKIDLAIWRAEKVLDQKRYLREFAVTNDGKRIGLLTAYDDTVIKSEGESRLDIWENGKVTTPNTDPYRALAASPHAWLEGLAWSADGNKIAFNAIFDAYPAEIVLGVRSESGWNISLMERPGEIHVHGYGSPLKWHSSGQLFFVAEKHGKSFVTSAEPTVLKNVSTLSPPDRVVYSFDTDDAGKIGAFIMGQSNQFGDIYVAEYRQNAEFRKLVELNPQTKNWKFPLVKHITWKAPDGTEVGGVLEMPVGAEPGTKLPLVVAMHGGPTTSSKAGLEFDPHNGKLYFSAKGYAVLLPNYRGSTGYGDKFVTQLIAKENEIEVNDIIAGVEQLVRDGVVDPNRVAVMGWSNGGYLTNCLITRNNLPFKLKAASSGAGILDTIMEWGINDEPAYPRVLKKGLPWEVPQTYHSSSPTYGLGRISTPTIIHVGGNDVRCPPEHSRMLYRAMREYVKVPAELIVYPNEPHGLSKYSHRLAKMQWDLAWFEKYLK